MSDCFGALFSMGENGSNEIQQTRDILMHRFIHMK